MKTSFKRFFRPVVVVGVLALVGVAMAEEPKGVLTLKKAINVALEQNPSVAEFKELMNAAREQIGVSRGALLPQANFSGTLFYGNAFSTRATGTAAVAVPGGAGSPISIPITPEKESTTFEVYRFSFNQLVYDFGKTPSQVAGSKASFKQAGEDYANTRQLVVLNARTGYFAYLASRRAIKVAEENVRQNQELLKQAQGFYKVGLRAKIDVTTAESNLANARTELIRAQNLAAISRVDLQTALGLKSWPYKDVEDILEVTPKKLSLEELKSKALKQRPEIRKSLFQQEGDKANIKGARASFFPSFQTFAAWGPQGDRHELEDEWWVGAGVNVPIFEGLSRYHSLRQAKAQLRSTKANSESVALTVRKEVEQSFEDLESAWEVIKSREKAKEAAAENLRLAWGRYRAGVGSIIEVTDAQIRFAQADLEQVRALFDYRVVEARLDKAIGKPY